MKKILIGAVAAGLTALPAQANHLGNLDTPFANRGACEAAVADFGNDDAAMLLVRFPNFFDSRGDVASFLARAFPCEKVNGSWYIQDHRAEWLASEWFSRK